MNKIIVSTYIGTTVSFAFIMALIVISSYPTYEVCLNFNAFGEGRIEFILATAYAGITLIGGLYLLTKFVLDNMRKEE